MKTRRKDRYTIVLTSALGACIVLLGISYLLNANILRLRVSPQSARADSATVILATRPDNERIFTGGIIENMTILEALTAATQAAQTEIHYQINADGELTIDAINSEINNLDGKQWHFYLNKQPIDIQQLDKAFITNGDIIEARYN